MNKQERDNALALKLLEAIGEHERVSQRHLTDRTGVDPRLTKLFRNRCVCRG